MSRANIKAEYSRIIVGKWCNQMLFSLKFRVAISANFDNLTKRKYTSERYQIFLWICDKNFRENAKNRHILAQNVQTGNDFW